eukprot:CAMPEP_0174386336 /NCGR_PEP_ID=MMETSP0811_2-20130205/127207_1 /TAXON_ID=73025 ORGANISM="Eutreptiella gymnastica-like, Strain CCMP1594" /NCGR_SAMPLE_ID=MMETSP0811_2 /ASSEMBLY_ACC=CAM_ASM_000667 /LENGTH=109 /DNA_ID=CAMNT_0015540971 /DNA_START=48 /DNA_END=374 /DNA_ORIENTATION=+
MTLSSAPHTLPKIIKGGVFHKRGKDMGEDAVWQRTAAGNWAAEASPFSCSHQWENTNEEVMGPGLLCCEYCELIEDPRVLYAEAILEFGCNTGNINLYCTTTPGASTSW